MWPFNRSLDSALNATRNVRIEGIKFKIKKINVLDFIEGQKVMFQYYETYRKDPKTQETDANFKKLRSHYLDIFMAGIVDPKLTRDPEQKDGGLWVEKLLSDWDLANGLYEMIIGHTYGKKKIMRAGS